MTNHARNIIALLSYTPRPRFVGDDEEDACVGAGGIWTGTECIAKLDTALDDLQQNLPGQTKPSGGGGGGGGTTKPSGGSGTTAPPVKSAMTTESKTMKYAKIAGGLLLGAAVVGGGAYYLTKKKKH